MTPHALHEKRVLLYLYVLQCILVNHHTIHMYNEFTEDDVASRSKSKNTFCLDKSCDDNTDDMSNNDNNNVDKCKNDVTKKKDSAENSTTNISDAMCDSL